MKKSAFTMAELLLVTAIIGIVSVYGLRTLNNIDKSVKYAYSNVYHSLDKALYNSFNFTSLKNPFVKKDVVNGSEVQVSDAEHIKRLCLMLTEYINSKNINCSAPAVSDLGTDLKTPHFISMNGIKFYISNMLPKSNNAEHYFMLVFADLNGNKLPNSMVYNPPKQEPDIFAFAALDTGRVCPIGIPEIEPNYMLTRISYYESKNDENAGLLGQDLADVKYSVNSKPYYITKAEAWGYYLSKNKLNDDFYIESNPLTYNGYIRNFVSKNSLIYKSLPKNLTVPEDITLKSNSVKNGGYNCVKGSDIECDVIVDKYLY